MKNGMKQDQEKNWKKLEIYILITTSKQKKGKKVEKKLISWIELQILKL
jgi:hypothetical protein